ncbi:hypothetical protein SSX86_014825 [Deinandra increscens subsp. villosa]|uniref:AAA+ ATPase domain-containing protein n=1 Tax=Deinandra increscens subsp. villosa TaxID=3103831 RepID=A0AAP0D2M4_9ASTR
MASRLLPEMPTLSSLLSAYAWLSTSLMLFRTIFDQLLSVELRLYVLEAVRSYWSKPKSPKLTLVFDEIDGLTSNHMFDAAEAFLCSRINPNSKRLRITKSVNENNMNIKFAESEEIVESFDGISVTWRYFRRQPKNMTDGDDAGLAMSSSGGSRGYFELEFDKTHKDVIINSYLPWVIKTSQDLQNEKKVVKLSDLRSSYADGSVNLDHPSTFDTLAMDPTVKKAIIDDLDLFLRRREFYKKVGKAWKRGYLLYGPPGTGKSSLIAAIANYLKFDIYDLKLKNVPGDSELMNMMLATSNRSIIVIEDIDCSMQLPDSESSGRDHDTVIFLAMISFSLSGLLNFIDGLWSCCGNERIIIVTTNHKERLDPALLRPGRMDVHIHMSYLTVDGFRTLAANYLNINDQHSRFREIEELIIKCKKVTPAEVAEELMKSEDVDVVLEGLVKFLKHKKMDNDETEDEFNDNNED